MNSNPAATWLKMGISLLASMLVSCSSTSVGAIDSMPRKFSAYVGGRMGPSYTVELKDGLLIYKAGVPERTAYRREETTIKPTSKQWQDFRRALDALHVWQWQPKYINSAIADGTQWTLVVEYTDHAITIDGNNGYPDASGKLSDQHGATKEFEDFCAAVENLIDGKNFR